MNDPEFKRFIARKKRDMKRGLKVKGLWVDGFCLSAFDVSTDGSTYAVGYTDDGAYNYGIFYESPEGWIKIFVSKFQNNQIQTFLKILKEGYHDSRNNQRV